MNIFKNKVTPKRDEFEKLLKKEHIVPVMKKIPGDMDTPISLFGKLYDEKESFLLESALSTGEKSQYSVIGKDPLVRIKSKDNITTVENSHGIQTYDFNPFDVIDSIMSNYKMNQRDDELRYVSGLTGYFSFDSIRYIENIKLNEKDDIDTPEIYLILPREVVIYDHYKNEISIVVNVIESEDTIKAYDLAIETIEKIEDIIKNGTINNKINNYIETDFEVESNFTKDEYKNSVLKAKEYIKEGDIFQVVLSQRLRGKIGISDFNVYRKLRSVNPSPYMYFLKFDDFSVVGASPEMLVKETGSKIETCPIAGTRKRGKTKEEDDFLAKDLLSDEKEIAEHVMLVDLGRNDVGKVSTFGSVKVENFKHVEKYSHVMHIVTNVKGEKKSGLSSIDVLKSILPAGTVSGAPKIRAMEIISELEIQKRGIYSGAIGHLGFDGNMDTCITIRTCIIKDGYAYVQAGAGIVADSIPEKEYLETMNKAKALLSVLGKEEK